MEYGAGKKNLLELRILSFLGGIEVCLHMSNDRLIALIQLFRSLTAGSLTDPSLCVISSGIKSKYCHAEHFANGGGPNRRQTYLRLTTRLMVCSTEGSSPMLA